MLGLLPSCGNADPVAYVLSLNLHRRHLDTSQRAMAGARAKDVYVKLAKERMRDGAARGNKTRHGKESPAVENLPQPAMNEGKARDQVAEVLGISGRTVDHAARVLRDGVPELIAAVEEARMAVSEASLNRAGAPSRTRRPSLLASSCSRWPCRRATESHCES